MYELGIELSIKDVQLLYKIKKLLGVGTIIFRNKNKKNNKNISNDSNINISYYDDINKVIYRIRNKSHLKEIIIPIFDKYPFLTNKQYDYIRFKNLLLSNVILSENLVSYTRPNLPMNSVESILNTSYFSV
jgi:ubiquinol-cytochrome c reductase cytochrome b subunit